jgi:hypothetical protein
MKGFLFALLFLVLSLAYVRSEEYFFGLKILEDKCAGEDEVCSDEVPCCGELQCSEFKMCRA